MNELDPPGRGEPSVQAGGFAFPLNVYARMLELQEGRVDHLHYGMFESEDQNVLAAQEHASALLWHALPGPCRLLEVGIGLGTTLAQLRAAGYAALGITPDAQQIIAALRRHGPDLPVFLSRLEDFDRSPGEWDALLFQESAQYVEPLELFAAADRLLIAGPATLVVMDEFALSRETDEHTGLHHLGDFCALAQRQGWRLDHRLDLSRQARPTLDYMARSVAAQRQRLIGDLQVTPDQLLELDASNKRYKRMYEQGVYGYALLRFRRERPARDQLVRIDDAKASTMQALFAAVFQTPMSPEHRAWKYGEGRGGGVGLQRDGRLVAHYGGVTRRISFFGRPALACQVCDVMVDKGAITALTRRGPMYQVAATFLESEIGWGRPHLIGFGFPNARAFGVAHRLGLYAEVDQVVQLSWSADAAAWPARVSASPVAVDAVVLTERERKVIDRLWRVMSDAFSDAVIAVRDAAWIQHRYLRRPDRRYDLVLVTRGWTRRPIGLLVLRQHERHLEVLDIVASPANFAALLGVARARAAVAGLERVECWITESHRHMLDGIDAEHLTVTDLGIRVPTNVHTPGPAPDELRRHWFLMSGDADFT